MEEGCKCDSTLAIKTVPHPLGYVEFIAFNLGHNLNGVQHWTVKIGSQNMHALHCLCAACTCMQMHVQPH